MCATDAFRYFQVFHRAEVRNTGLKKQNCHFGHICRIQDDRLIKMVIVGGTEGTQKHKDKEDQMEDGWITKEMTGINLQCAR